MVSFVVGGRLLGWLPRTLIAGAAAAGAIRLLDVPELALDRRFHVYRRSRGLLAPATRRLLELLPLVPIPSAEGLHA